MKNDSKRMKRLNALYFVVAGALSVTFLSGCKDSDSSPTLYDGNIGAYSGVDVDVDPMAQNQRSRSDHWFVHQTDLGEHEGGKYEIKIDSDYHSSYGGETDNILSEIVDFKILGLSYLNSFNKGYWDKFDFDGTTPMNPSSKSYTLNGHESTHSDMLDPDVTDLEFELTNESVGLVTWDVSEDSNIGMFNSVELELSQCDNGLLFESVLVENDDFIEDDNGNKTRGYSYLHAVSQKPDYDSQTDVDWIEAVTPANCTLTVKFDVDGHITSYVLPDSFQPKKWYQFTINKDYFSAGASFTQFDDWSDSNIGIDLDPDFDDFSPEFLASMRAAGYSLEQVVEICQTDGLTCNDSTESEDETITAVNKPYSVTETVSTPGMNASITQRGVQNLTMYPLTSVIAFIDTHLVNTSGNGPLEFTGITNVYGSDSALLSELESNNSNIANTSTNVTDAIDGLNDAYLEFEITNSNFDVATLGTVFRYNYKDYTGGTATMNVTFNNGDDYVSQFAEAMEIVLNNTGF
ncbi:hypothetical protein VCHA56P521_160092 [Vibrio chagasii]|nr:hypothetical protein VCHA36P168_150092 [Vibrio chagasii]CAH7223084.1 hypothetical protein VCHA56P521_160092 [Vibrio chagasii]